LRVQKKIFKRKIWCFFTNRKLLTSKNKFPHQKRTEKI